MKEKLFAILLCCLFFYSCSNKIIPNKGYVFKDDSKRKLILTFQNDSVCVIKNLYNSDTNGTMEFIYKCRYSILSNEYILLTNNGSLIDTAGIGYFYFPEKPVDSLLIKKEKYQFTTGPNYLHHDDKYLKVPYVDNDTLIRHKANLMWLKKDRNKNVVGYFKFK